MAKFNINLKKHTDMRTIVIWVVCLLNFVASTAQTENAKKRLDGAEKGVWEDMYFLGLMYFDGDEIQKDIDKAVYWLSKAEEKSEFGHTEYALGLCYEAGGTTTVKDYKKAADWVRKAAEKNHIKAQICLARYYLKGMGVEENFDLCLFWVNKAALLGDEGAIAILAKNKASHESIKEKYIGKKIYWYEELHYNPGESGIGSFLTAATGIGIIKYKIKYTAIIESFIGDDALKAIISKAIVEDPSMASINYLKYRDLAVKEANKAIGETRAKDMSECGIE
jgi:tetratricopeptide (TPR) repeat protein